MQVKHFQLQDNISKKIFIKCVLFRVFKGFFFIQVLVGNVTYFYLQLPVEHNKYNLSSLLSTSYRTLVKAIMIVLQSQRTSDYIPLKLKKSLRFVNSLHSDMFMVSFTQICSMSFSLYFFLPLIKSAILLLCIHYAIGYIKMVKRNLLVMFIY